MKGKGLHDGDRMVAWVREAADELEKAHAFLDAHGVPRALNPDDAVECTLAARIALAFGADPTNVRK